MRFLFSTRLINNSLGLLRSPRTAAPIRSLWFPNKSPVFRSATNPILAATAFSSSMAIPPNSEEALPGKLWIKFNRECLFSIYSPFAVCLAAGNLKIDTFRQYIAQDVHFLKAFAHAYELAAECADDDDDKLAISNLRKSVMEELKMHDSFVQRKKNKKPPFVSSLSENSFACDDSTKRLLRRRRFQQPISPPPLSLPPFSHAPISQPQFFLSSSVRRVLLCSPLIASPCRSL